MSRNKLYTKPTYFRSMVTQSDKGIQVDPAGGKFDGGVIYNVSVITKGEALGHGMWIDSHFINQVSAQMALANDKGIKVRFTHPNQSGDGLAKGMGRAFFKQSSNGKVFADIHMWKSAHDTPDGNLAGYVLERAAEDPSSFGTSISFLADQEATEMHKAENSEHGHYGTDDEANDKNLEHVRLKSLKAVDFVDEPAANPDGLFSIDDTFKEAEALMQYITGLSEDKPEGSSFGVDPDRISGFLTRFMESNNMKIVMADDLKTADLSAEMDQEVVEAVEEVVAEVVEAEAVEAECGEDCECHEEAPAEEVVAEEVEEVEEAEVQDEVVEQPAVEAEGVEAALSEEVDPNADLKKYVATFGAEFGTSCFIDGKDFETAQAEFIVSLQSEKSKLEAALSLQSETEGEALSAGGPDVVEKANGFATNILGQFK